MIRRLSVSYFTFPKVQKKNVISILVLLKITVNSVHLCF